MWAHKLLVPGGGERELGVGKSKSSPVTKRLSTPLRRKCLCSGNSAALRPAPLTLPSPQKARCTLLGFLFLLLLFDFLHCCFHCCFMLRTIPYHTTILEGYPDLVHDFLIACTITDHVFWGRGQACEESAHKFLQT